MLSANWILLSLGSKEGKLSMATTFKGFVELLKKKRASNDLNGHQF